MLEKKVAMINISKALIGVSFATLAAIGSASGGMLIAGLTACPAAVLTVEPILTKLKSRKEELLELAIPPWWTSDTITWDNLCTEIGHYLLVF